jgi:type VI secretion system Hcp family effector
MRMKMPRLSLGSRKRIRRTQQRFGARIGTALERLEDRRMLVNVALFSDPTYVDSAGAGASIAASLESLGHTVVPVPVAPINSMGWQPVLNGNEAVAFPAFTANYAAAIGNSGVSTLRNHLEGGARMIVFGTMTPFAAAFLNRLLAPATIQISAAPLTTESLLQPAAGTPFSGVPANLPSHQQTTALQQTSLPATALSIYAASPQETTVVWSPIGNGGLTYLGWDWTGAAPTGPLDGGWLNVLDRAAGTPATEQHFLTVTRSGAGSGTVTSAPAGIDCGASCIANYDAGTLVTLSASSDVNSVFAGWSGDCAGPGECVVTMDAAKAVTATFTPVQHALTVTLAGSGSGTVTSAPAGIDCGVSCTASYDSGTLVTLSAAPDANSTFAAWSGDCAGTGQCVVTMDAAKAVTATFTPVQHALTVTLAGAGSGTVTSAPVGIECGASCAASYDSSTIVTLSAAPDANSTFAGWSGDCAGTSQCVVTMDAARTVTATFSIFVPDTTPPATPPVPDLDSASDSGDSNVDNATNVDAATIHFVAEPGSLVELHSDSGVDATMVSPPSGTGSFTRLMEEEGIYYFRLVAQDAAGNRSAFSPTLAVTIDRTSPAAPAAPDMASHSDTGDSDTDNYTAEVVPQFWVLTTAGGTTVQVFEGMTLLGQDVTSASGQVLVTLGSFGEGPHTIYACARDVAGNVSAPCSPPLTFTIDTTPPDTPAAPVLDVVSDTGSSSTDGITNDTTPTLTGTAEIGAAVNVFNDLQPLGTATRDTPTTWTFASPPLSPGRYAFTLFVTDAAGNSSQGSSSTFVVVDTTGPSPAIAALSPTSDRSPTVLVAAADPGSSGHLPDGTPALIDIDLNHDGQFLGTGELGYTSVPLASGAGVAELMPPLVAGIYSLRVRLTDLAGNEGVGSIFVLTIQNQPPQVATGGPYVGNVGEPVPLDFSGSQDDGGEAGEAIAEVRVDLNNDGLPDLITSSLTPTIDWATLAALVPPLQRPADPETALPNNEIDIAIMDSLGAVGMARTTLTIYDNRPVAAIASDTQAVGCNAPIVFSAAGSHHGHPDQAIVKYEWDFDYNAGAGFTLDADTGATPSVAHTYLSRGLHTTAVRITDDNTPPKQSLGTMDVLVEFENMPPTVADRTETVDKNETIAIHAMASEPNAPCDSIASYAWDLDDDGAFDDATGETVTITPTEFASLGWTVGLNQVSVQVLDRAGAAAVGRINVIVNDIRPISVLDVTPNPASANGTVTLDGTGSFDPNGGAIALYEWDTDYDPGATTFDVDAVGPVVANYRNVNWDFQGGGTLIALRVTNLDGASHTAVTRLTFQDGTPPDVVVVAPLVITSATPEITVQISDDRPLPVGTPAVLHVDLNNDGDFADPGELGHTTALSEVALPDGSMGPHDAAVTLTIDGLGSVPLAPAAHNGKIILWVREENHDPARPGEQTMIVAVDTSRASPGFLLATAEGRHFDQAVLTVHRRVEDRFEPYMKYILEDLLVSGYSVSSGGDRPTESLSLNFTKIEFEYLHRGPTGSIESIVAEHDFFANQGTGAASLAGPVGLATETYTASFDGDQSAVEVLSFNLGVTHTGLQSTAGEVTLVKELDRISPALFLKAARGEHIPEVTLRVHRRVDGQQQEYMTYKFTDVLLTGVRPGGSSQGGEPLPLEEVTFNYSKIETTHIELKRDYTVQYRESEFNFINRQLSGPPTIAGSLATRDEARTTASFDSGATWLELLSFDWGVTQSGESTIGSSPGTVTFSKYVGAESPALLLFCAAGRHIPEVSLSLSRVVDGGPVEYLRVKFTDVLITGVRPSGSSQGGDPVPLEEVSFNYAKVEFEYKEQAIDGGSESHQVQYDFELDQGSVSVPASGEHDDGDDADQTISFDAGASYVPISDVQWGLSRAMGGGGPAAADSLSFVMSVNKASPALMLACAKGEHIPEVILTLHRTVDGRREAYLQITMTDVLISSFQSGGSSVGDNVPTDQVSINFTKVEFNYIEQKADGTTQLHETEYDFVLAQGSGEEEITGEHATSDAADEMVSFDDGATWIAVQGYGWGLEQGVGLTESLRLALSASKATPALMLACANGHHIPKVIVTLNRTIDGRREEYLRVTFTDLLVSSYQTGASGGGDIVPTDQVSFNYSKIEFQYIEQKADGGRQLHETNYDFALAQGSDFQEVAAELSSQVSAEATLSLDGRRSWFEIKDFSFGVENPTTLGSASGGAGAGKVKFNEFTIKVPTSKGTPQLMLACATGEHIPDAVLTLHRIVDGRREEYLQIILEDVLITTYQTGGGGGDVPIDQVSINFSKIEFKYTEQTSDGSLESRTARYDQGLGKSVLDVKFEPALPTTGTFRMQAQIADAAGNLGTSDVVTVTRTNTLPVVARIEISGGEPHAVVEGTPASDNVSLLIENGQLLVTSADGVLAGPGFTQRDPSTAFVSFASTPFTQIAVNMVDFLDEMGEDGDDTITFASLWAPAIYQLTINAGTGDDHVTIASHNAGSTVQVNGNVGDDILFVQGTANADSFSVTPAGAILIENAVVDGSNFESVVVDGLGGNDAVSFPTATDLEVFVDAGAPSGRIGIRRDTDRPLLLAVEDVFTIVGRELRVTGGQQADNVELTGVDFAAGIVQLNNLANVHFTGAQSLRVATDDGDDRVSIAPFATRTRDWGLELDVEGGAGFNRLLYEDVAGRTTNTRFVARGPRRGHVADNTGDPTILHVAVAFTAFDEITLVGNPGDGDRLILEGTAQSDTIHIDLDAASQSPTVRYTGGAVVVVHAATFDSLEIDGREGRDTFTLDASATGSFALPVPLTITGGDPIGLMPGDTLQVLSGTNPATFKPGPQSDEGGFQVGTGEALSFDRIEMSSLIGGGAASPTPTIFATGDNDQISANDLAGGVVLSVNGRAVLESAMFLTIRLDTLAGNDNIALSSSLVEVISGDGDDTIELYVPAVQRLDAGRGNDTLRLAAAGLSLDLTALPFGALTGIEQIDMTGAASNTLVLDAQRVRDVSATDSLRVTADMQDRAQIGAGWTVTGLRLDAGELFSVFTHADAALLVTNPVVGDLDGNQIVERDDVARLLARFATLAAADRTSGDFNGDGWANNIDLALLQQNLGRRGIVLMDTGEPSASPTAPAPIAVRAPVLERSSGSRSLRARPVARLTASAVDNVLVESPHYAANTSSPFGRSLRTSTHRGKTPRAIDPFAR